MIFVIVLFAQVMFITENIFRFFLNFQISIQMFEGNVIDENQHHECNRHGYRKLSEQEIRALEREMRAKVSNFFNYNLISSLTAFTKNRKSDQ